MPALILDGKKLATLVEADLAERVAKIKERTQQTPILATILVDCFVISLRQPNNATRS